jgi:heat shock protein HtpX
VRRAVDPRRELAADLAAARLTRYPPGLAAALDRLAEVGTAVPSAPAAVAHLWFAAPGAGGDESHPRPDERAEALREL